MSLGASDAVLLMAHGGPLSLEEIPAFLSHIRGGRPISDAFLAEVIERYSLVGGFSPLKGICDSLANKLGALLDLPVYVGMRHTTPFIDETIVKIASHGHRRVLGICLAPHYSDLSIGKYHEAATLANASLERPLEMNLVSAWGNNPLFIDYHVHEIKKLIHENSKTTQVLLTAHSLPSRILQAGDPYAAQLEQTQRAIASRLLTVNEPRLIFQSASPSPEPWLGPSLEETLEEASAKGWKNIVISPIGFVADNIEILYDLDIMAKGQAQDLGIGFRRSQMLNDSSEMVAILADIVEQSSMEQNHA